MFLQEQLKESSSLIWFDRENSKMEGVGAAASGAGVDALDQLINRTRAAIDDMGGKLATMMTASTHNGVASRLVNAVLTCVSEAHELRGRDIFQTRAVSTGNGSQAAEKEEGHKRQKQERGKAKAR